MNKPQKLALIALATVMILTVVVSRADALGPGVQADDTKQASCTHGSNEDLTGDMFADGLLTIRTRCFLNNSSSLGSVSKAIVDAAIDVTRGAAGLQSTAYFLYRTSNSSATCQSPVFTAIEHGQLIKTDGTTYPASAGGSSMPTNYLEYTLDCPYTVFTSSDWTQLSQGNSPLGISDSSVNHFNATGYAAIDYAEVVQPGLSPGFPSNFDDLANSPSPFQFGFPPASACELVDYALQVNGTGYDLVQLQDVVVYPSDTIVLIVDSNGAYPDDVNLLSWTYRAQPQDLFFRNPVYVDTALDEIHTYRIEVKAAQPAGEIEVRCVANDFSETFLRLGDNNHGDSAALNRACTSLVVFLPDGEYSTGDEVVASFDLDAGPYVDGDTGVDVVIWEFVQGGPNLETTLVESFDRFGAQIGGGVPYLHHVPIDSDGELRFLMPGDGLATQLEVTCTDTTGEKRVLGTGDVESGSFVVSISGQDSCYGGAGMKATAPSTWVAGIFVGAGCFVETLFVPSDSDLAGQLERINGLRDAPPLQWVDEGVTFIGSTSISFDTWASAGPACVDVLGTDICPQTWDNGSGALPAWFLGAFAFGLWSLIVFTVWRFF